MRVKEGDLVKIDWVDITSESTWTSMDKAKASEPSDIVDVGILIHKSKKKVVIANSISEDFQCSYTVFPKNVIKRIRKLKCQRKKN